MALPVELTQRGLNSLPVSMRVRTFGPWLLPFEPDSVPVRGWRWTRANLNPMHPLRPSNGSCLTSEQKILALSLLPVCFAHLDPAAIPSLEQQHERGGTTSGEDPVDDSDAAVGTEVPRTRRVR
ncbi:hypothetical protein C8F01DRAFT_1255154 [Mycena amicta]|nr:hypothetical protein C8F01DRAFT_1255154 [Mycena amicta]